MAINYNEDGLYLGYFETLGSLMAQYNGRRGNSAIVKNAVWVHNGERWINCSDIDLSDIRASIDNQQTVIEEISKQIGVLDVAGIKIKWSYRNTIEAEEDTPEGWFDSPLTADKDNPICYISSRYSLGANKWSSWAAPSVFSRYIAEPASAPGYQYIFYRSNADDVAATLYNELLNSYDNVDFQNDDFVPEGWSENLTAPTKAYPYIYVAMRKTVAGVWGKYNYPAIGYTWAQGENGENGKNAITFFLTDERIGVACNSEGVPTDSDTVKTYMKLYDGTKEVDVSEIQFGYLASSTIPTIAGNEVRMTIDSYTPQYYQINLTAIYKGVTYKTPWTIEKLIPAIDGVSPKVFRLNLDKVVVTKDAENKLTENEIIVSATLSYENSVTEITTQEQFVQNDLTYRITAGDETLVISDVIPNITLMLTRPEAGSIVVGEDSILVYIENNIKIDLLYQGSVVDTQTVTLVADGTVDYEIVREHFSEYLQTDEQWQNNLSMVQTITTFLGGVGFVQTNTFSSILKATANEINANVSSQVNDVLKEAGWNVTADGVVIYGDYIKIAPNKDSSKYVALFDSEGYLNANLIKAKGQFFYDENGNLRSSINRYMKGEYIIYHEATQQDDPPKQVEMGLDADTNSFIRVYDVEGNILKMITLDGNIEQPEITTSTWFTLNLSYVGKALPTLVQTEYSQYSTYYRYVSTDVNDELNGMVCNTKNTTDIIADGWYTNPGLSIKIQGASNVVKYRRTYQRYENGKSVEVQLVESTDYVNQY